MQHLYRSINLSSYNLLTIKALTSNKMPSRINNIFGKTEVDRRFRPSGRKRRLGILFLGSP